MLKIGEKDKFFDVKINYVIAAWSGNRRLNDHRYNNNRNFYLCSQLKNISKLKTSIIKQITIAIPHNLDEPENYRDCIPEKINGIPVIVMERPNVGLSYGSFSDVYGYYKDQFDYYIFMEDDYTFSVNNFDIIMVELIRQDCECGFVCALFKNSHAAMFAGLADQEALGEIWDRYKKLPYANNSEYSPNEVAGQIGQSLAYSKLGWKIKDVRNKYKVGFRHGNMRIQWFGNLSKPTLIEPI